MLKGVQIVTRLKEWAVPPATIRARKKCTPLPPLLSVLCSLPVAEVMDVVKNAAVTMGLSGWAAQSITWLV